MNVRPPLLARVLAPVALCALAAPSLAIDHDHRARALDMIARAGDYLRSQQHATGGWNLPEDPAAPVLPAITGLVINGLALEPADDDRAGHDQSADDQRDDAMSRGVAFILSNIQPDGGIYAQQLPSYNTAICVSALCQFRDDNPEADAAIGPALAFLRGLQWGEDAGPVYPDGSASPAANTVQVVAPDHPFYGGIGYGRSGRPDNSNLSLCLQSFHDAGIDRDDPVFQRALVFLRRTQMHATINDAEYAKGSHQGGFIYATAESGAAPGIGQSQAGVIEETLDDGTVASRLRAYGSMTYSAFKTLIYAGLSQDDPRVRLALEWIQKNYTVTENPGLGTAGLYYYYLALARALNAADIRTIHAVVADAQPARKASPDQPAASITGSGSVCMDHDWANDLIDQLATLQNDDGSFRSVDGRWMENDSVLISAYAMLALEHAVGLAQP